MPTSEELFVRMLRQFGNRLDRVEGAGRSEAIPNPLVNGGEDTVSVSDSVSVSKSYPGDMQFGDPFSISTWAGQPLFRDSFESGTLGEWVVTEPSSEPSFAPVQDRVFDGSWAVFVSGNRSDGDPDTSVASRSLWKFGAVRISRVSFAYQETADSAGGGLRIRNSASEYECGVATDSPQWVVNDATGFEALSTGPSVDVGVWVVVSIWFDWDAGLFDVEFRVPSSPAESAIYRDRSLVSALDAEALEFWTYDSGSWGGSPVEMWVDEIRVQ